jgi:tRNA A-37 threonylcarbamoyl transferase component Bud32
VKLEFGPYTLMRRHAVGGMSMVFVAQDSTLHREVALKILSEEFSADERRIAAFEEEARITASFSHPNVVRVFTTGKAFGRLYIAMELVPGGHFEHQIRERGKIPEEELLPLAIEVAEGLKAAHAAALIHRDIKPGNILLDADHRAKIVDFGLALVTQGGKAQASELWATPYYVPPETIEGAPEDFRSDIYAFGATLYHALAGVPSCGEESMATDVLRDAKRRVVPLGTVNPGLSVLICQIVARAMAHDPRNRFEFYDEMIADLNTALKRWKSGSAMTIEARDNLAMRRARKQRGERAVLGMAALVLLGSAVAGIWWVIRKEPRQATSVPVIVDGSAVVPELPVVGATEIARSYREARAAVEAGEFDKAGSGFSKLLENDGVQEPTRSWAGVEAVIASYLAGNGSEAKARARAAEDHLMSVDSSSWAGEILAQKLGELHGLPAIPASQIAPDRTDAATVMSWMLAGLKDWEQGLTGEASHFFSAVVAAKITGDDGGLAIYQKLAAGYLADGATLSGPVFQALLADPAACEAAVSELESMLGSLHSRGRARFNIRAWQLDLKRHAKLLGMKSGTRPPE